MFKKGKIETKTNNFILLFNSDHNGPEITFDNLSD